MAKMKLDNSWVDEFFKEDTAVDHDADAERKLDYALSLVDSSTFRATGSLELKLVDEYRQYDDLDWSRLFTCLRLNQLRCVDNYSYTQRELSRWIRLIAFHEYR